MQQPRSILSSAQWARGNERTVVRGGFGVSRDLRASRGRSAGEARAGGRCSENGRVWASGGQVEMKGRILRSSEVPGGLLGGWWVPWPIGEQPTTREPGIAHAWFVCFAGLFC